MAENKPEMQLDNLEDLKTLVKTAVSKMGPQYSKEEKIAQAKILLKVFEQGIAPREAMNIPEEEIARMYSFAYSLFNTGQYANARELFKMLIMFDPFNQGFASALGVCHHRLKDYKNAARCYMLAASLDESDPLPLFYAYDCFDNLKERGSAAIMLCNVITRAGDNPKFAKLKERTELLLKALDKQLLETDKSFEVQRQAAQESM